MFFFIHPAILLVSKIPGTAREKFEQNYFPHEIHCENYCF
jgi:hypothetical protein